MPVLYLNFEELGYHQKPSHVFISFVSTSPRSPLLSRELAGVAAENDMS